MRVHLITAESPASRRLRRGRLIQFPQLTMPLIAALTPGEHDVRHTDEIVDPVRFDAPADLVGITAPTPSALHAYDLAREFRRRGVPVVIGGPHATALPEEAARHADAETLYVCTRQAPLAGMPAPRWDLIKGRLLDPAALRTGDLPVPPHRRGGPRGRHQPDARGRVLGRQHRRAPALREGSLQGAHAAPEVVDEPVHRQRGERRGARRARGAKRLQGAVHGPMPGTPTEWIARRFYSPRSTARRLAGSRTGLWWSLPRNVGYVLAGLSNAAPSWDPGEHDGGESRVSIVRRACGGPS